MVARFSWKSPVSFSTALEHGWALFRTRGYVLQSDWMGLCGRGYDFSASLPRARMLISLKDRYQSREMEDLPTLGQFKELLYTDPIFCDYFNAFLNLPVSSVEYANFTWLHKQVLGIRKEANVHQ